MVALPARARAAARRVRRRLASQPSRPGPEPAPNGLVEVFTPSEIKGWVSVPHDAPPVRITLRVNDLVVTTTYATSPPSEAQLATGPRDADAPGAVAATGALHTTPAPLRRNSWREVRSFALALDDLWTFTRRSAKISVRARNRPLPIYGHGMYLQPAKNGTEPLATLREKLAGGYVFSQYGTLQLSKKLDVDWQLRVMRLYEQVREVVYTAFGHEVFLTYGTLLGAVREGGYIAHDLDFDTAYISEHTEGPPAARELQQIAFTLVEHGIDAQAMVTAIHIRDPDDPEVRVDLFHLYFDANGVLRSPFGVAGTTTLTKDGWRGTRELEFERGRPLVPVDAEQFVEHLYGSGWREPKPGFNWALERTQRAADADVSRSMRLQSHWANFYARNDPQGSSTFADFVLARADTPANVIDIGCGNGRDSFAFVAAGRTVTGLDFSHVAVEHATTQAAKLGVTDRAGFRLVDVADLDQVRRALLAGIGHGPRLFYLRFFLHAIEAGVQDGLMAAIQECTRPGDHLAAEFRTTKDRNRPKAHRTHYRRYQDGPGFGRELTDRYGFILLHEDEGTGLAPYRDEDPLVYRVIARRS